MGDGGKDARPTVRRRTGWVTGALGIAGVLALIILPRLAREQIAAAVFVAADGAHVWMALLVVAWAALAPVLLLGAAVAYRRSSRWRWVLVGAAVAVGTPLLAFLPGRQDDGRTELALDRATALGSGSVLIAAAVAGLVGILVCAFAVHAVVRLAGEDRPALGRGLGAGAYVATWLAVAIVTLLVVPPGAGRSAQLDDTAAELRLGETGTLGDFDPGLRVDRVEVVGCDEAVAALRVDGDRPEPPGCRAALLVHATGLSGAARTEDGDLVAVLFQARRSSGLEALHGSLDGAEIVGGAGLPAGRGPTYVTRVTASGSVLVASEDSGDIPRPDEGAGATPLTRALAYLHIGVVNEFPLAPEVYDG